jgi:dTDP-4-dehydrorhamnose reductase
MTDVDECELHPDSAHRVNAAGTENVALACRETKCALLYVSTGHVFNGRSTRPYTEDDLPDPINAYGRTKYEGEQFVREHVERHYIIRACWVYGKGDRKFISSFVERAQTQDSVAVVVDKAGSPTWSRDLAEAVVSLAESDRFGTYHVANAGVATRFEMAELILAVTGIKCGLRPVDSRAFPLPAPRPDMEALASRRLKERGFPLPRSWEEALTEFLRTPAGRRQGDREEDTP